MVRGFLAMGAAALLALVVLADGARAGDCAGCGTVLASPQASEQVLPAPQGGCYAPVTYCEEQKSCHLLDKCKGIGHGLSCKLDGLKCNICDMGSGLKCKLHGMGSGLKCKLASLKCHKAEPTCYTPCVTPTEQCPSPQGPYPAPQGGFVAPAPQFPSAQ